MKCSLTGFKKNNKNQLKCEYPSSLFYGERLSAQANPNALDKNKQCKLQGIFIQFVRARSVKRTGCLLGVAGNAAKHSVGFTRGEYDVNVIEERSKKSGINPLCSKCNPPPF
jgi:hypothetical protein